MKDVIDFDEKRVGVVVPNPLVALKRVHGALFKRKPIIPTAILMIWCGKAVINWMVWEINVAH